MLHKNKKIEESVNCVQILSTNVKLSEACLTCGVGSDHPQESTLGHRLKSGPGQEAVDALPHKLRVAQLLGGLFGDVPVLLTVGV